MFVFAKGLLDPADAEDPNPKLVDGVALLEAPKPDVGAEAPFIWEAKGDEPNVNAVVFDTGGVAAASLVNGFSFTESAVPFARWVPPRAP